MDRMMSRRFKTLSSLVTKHGHIAIVNTPNVELNTMYRVRLFTVGGRAFSVS